MKNKINNIHLIIMFGLIFLVPVAERIDHDFGEITKYLTLGYLGIVTLVVFIKLTKDSLWKFGLKRCLFNLWLYLSLLSGAVGLYGMIMSGLDDAPWTIWLVLYGCLVGYLNRNKLNY